MSINNLTVVSGTATTEQDFIVALDNTLAHVFGWELVRKNSDSSSDRDYWFRSAGEQAGTYMPLYARVRGFSNALEFYTYSNLTAAGVSSDEVYNSSVTKISISTSFDFWISGNKDIFYVMVKGTTNNHFMGGVGYLDTPYTSAQDPLPAFSTGQGNATTLFTGNRVRSYSAPSWWSSHTGGALGGPFLDAGTSTSSGVENTYIGTGNTILQYASPLQRDGRYMCTPVSLYIGLTTDLITSEFRGSLPNLWGMWGDSASMGGIVTASGININSDSVVSDANFIVMTEFNQDDNTYIIGPVDDYDISDRGVPHSVGGVQLYLAADRGIERNGGAFTGGKVSNWRDQHYHPSLEAAYNDRNDGTQGTEANQPTPVEGVVNSKPVVRFVSGSSTNLTGTFSVDNDMTLFAVASYSNGSNRCPILNVRGDISSVDTLFSLEFNENSSNSATAVNIAAAGTDREEVTSLSSDTMYILTNTVSGTTTTLYVDGWDGSSSTITNTKGTVAAGPADLNYSIGVDKLSGGSNGTSFADADVAEVIVFDKYLTNEERQRVLCSLSQKYNITVSGSC
jgi:hypothetical protein